jgi:hypothetical protein
MTTPLFGTTAPHWTDMSDHVVHFTKPAPDQTAYGAMMSILFHRKLEARSAFGFVRDKAPDPETQKTVCFSETPLHLLGRVADHRSEFGIVFRKDYVLQNGGNPILYAYKDQPVTQAIHHLVSAAAGNPANPIWKVTPFIDRPGAYGSATYFFEWEREWRIVGDLSFDTKDVAFLIIPEGSHEAARIFFEGARDDHTGPCYDCPYIDGHWSLEKTTPVLQGLAA